MKIFKQSFTGFALAFLTMLFACTSDFEEINTDPNNPNEVPADFVLTEAETALGNAMFNLDLAGATYIQHVVSQGINAPYNVYAEIDARDNTFNTTRDHKPGLYDGVLMELQEVINIVEGQEVQEAGDINLMAVARLLKAYTYQLMTDSWGDIPYSEALQGVETFSVPYDPQSEIYADLVQEIDQSLAMLDAGGDVSGDVIYGGDVEKWIRFGNSLKLRVAMRMSEVDSQAAQTMAGEALQAGVILTNEDNASIQYIASAENDFAARFRVLFIENGAVGSSVMIDYMSQTQDPRLPVYFAPAASSGEFVGLPVGLRQYVTPGNEISALSPAFTNQDASYELINADEMYFLQAEMMVRGWLSGDAASAYETAVTLSMEKLGIGSDQIAAFLAQEDVSFSEENAMEMIGTQKWLSQYFQGANAWAEWRRLEYPVLSPAPDAVNNIQEIPSRLVYPINERFLNESAYQEAVSRLGGDTYQTKLWWDVE